MPDRWLNLIGLSFSTALLVYLVVRCVKPIRTGIFSFGSGLEVHRETSPKDFAFCVRFQIVATAIFFAVYCFLIYRKFFTDLDWLSPIK